MAASGGSGGGREGKKWSPDAPTTLPPDAGSEDDGVERTLTYGGGVGEGRGGGERGGGGLDRELSHSYKRRVARLSTGTRDEVERQLGEDAFVEAMATMANGVLEALFDKSLATINAIGIPIDIVSPYGAVVEHKAGAAPASDVAIASARRMKHLVDAYLNLGQPASAFECLRGHLLLLLQDGTELSSGETLERIHNLCSAFARP